MVVLITSRKEAKAHEMDINTKCGGTGSNSSQAEKPDW